MGWGFIFNHAKLVIIGCLFVCDNSWKMYPISSVGDEYLFKKKHGIHVYESQKGS